MKLGVNLVNFGPGSDPEALALWARTADDLGYDSVLVSDHVAVTSDVAESYPETFQDPFVTLAWLAGQTSRVRLGTTVVILPYRHPALTARLAANIDHMSGGRLIFGVGAGWSRLEFIALGVPFETRGRMTDEYIEAIKALWAGRDDRVHRGFGNSPAAGTAPSDLGWGQRLVVDQASGRARGRLAPDQPDPAGVLGWGRRNGPNCERSRSSSARPVPAHPVQDNRWCG